MAPWALVGEKFFTLTFACCQNSKHQQDSDMPHLTDQTITFTLFPSEPVGSDVVPDVSTDVFVSAHKHDHGGLVGLFDDDHPQYLTYDRGVQLFSDLFGSGTVFSVVNLGTESRNECCA